MFVTWVGAKQHLQLDHRRIHRTLSMHMFILLGWSEYSGARSNDRRSCLSIPIGTRTLFAPDDAMLITGCLRSAAATRDFLCKPSVLGIKVSRRCARRTPLCKQQALTEVSSGGLCRHVQPARNGNAAVVATTMCRALDAEVRTTYGGSYEKAFAPYCNSGTHKFSVAQTTRTSLKALGAHTSLYMFSGWSSMHKSSLNICSESAKDH